MVGQKVRLITCHYNDNRKNDLLVLGEGDTFGINGSLGAPEKKLILILVKQRQNFA